MNDLDRAIAAFKAANDDDTDELIRLALSLRAAMRRQTAPWN
jgi:hypothetical protein